MSTKPNITIVIPCHLVNDRTLRAIRSAQWSKELIIIDQNAHADWSKLQKESDFTVIKHPKLTSFSDMKNEALSHVTTQWVFFLDSDEYITPELAAEITEIIANETTPALSIKRRDIFLNKPLFHGETRGAKFIRIVKTKDAHWTGKVHEELHIKNSAVSIQLRSALYHEPHPSLHEFVSKVNFYTSFLATRKENLLTLKSVLFPLGKFFYTFIVKRGFLDGYRGLAYSFVMAIHSSAVRIKRYETL